MFGSPHETQLKWEGPKVLKQKDNGNAGLPWRIQVTRSSMCPISVADNG